MLTWPATEIAELKLKLSISELSVEMVRAALRERDAEIERLRSENVRLREMLYAETLDGAALDATLRRSRKARPST